MNNATVSGGKDAPASQHSHHTGKPSTAGHIREVSPAPEKPEINLPRVDKGNRVEQR